MRINRSKNTALRQVALPDRADSQDHHQRWWLAAAGPSKGPDRRRIRTGPTSRSLRGLGRVGEVHNPGTVKLWESPGRAGGLPIELIWRSILGNDREVS